MNKWLLSMIWTTTESTKFVMNRRSAGRLGDILPVSILLKDGIPLPRLTDRKAISI